jgi:hypothetical protein
VPDAFPKRLSICRRNLLLLFFSVIILRNVALRDIFKNLDYRKYSVIVHLYKPRLASVASLYHCGNAPDTSRWEDRSSDSHTLPHDLSSRASFRSLGKERQAIPVAGLNVWLDSRGVKGLENPDETDPPASDNMLIGRHLRSARLWSNKEHRYMGLMENSECHAA